MASGGIELGCTDEHRLQLDGNVRVDESALAQLGCGVLARETKGERHSQRVHVAAYAGLPIAELLGRRIAWRAVADGVVRRALVEHACDAEVDEREALLRDNHVGWLHVAMDDGGVERLVQLGERVAELGHHALGEFEPGGLPLRHVAQRLAFHMFHDHGEGVSLAFALVDDRLVRQALARDLSLQELLVHVPAVSHAHKSLADERP